jgi:hypothetical protein
MKLLYACVVEVACWENDNSALVPELWALEALMSLQSNMVMGSLVHRDFNPLVANFGDVVNASRPADFKGKRKTDSDNIVLQDAVSPNIPVPLDQHIYVSFIIKDGELSKAAPDLIQRYLEPAARELAEKVDQVLCGQVARLTTHKVGGLGLMTKANASDYVLAANTQLDINRAPKGNRNLVLGPRAQQAALGADLFVSAEKRGDAGTALRNASLGTVYGLDSFMDQNVSYVTLGSTDYEAAVVSGAHAAGYASTIPTTITFASTAVGEYVTIGGIPYRIAATTDNSGDATITLDRALEAAVSASDPIVHYPGGETSAHAAGYSKELTIDQYAANKHPQLGQWITFGTGANSHTYSVIAVTALTTTSCTVLLDRPLSALVSDNQDAFFGPAGGINLAFTRDAVALVNRPLVTVPADSGARSFVASYEGLSMRVTMQYDITAQGMVVTFDLLCGVAILDERQAVAVYS